MHVVAIARLATSIDDEAVRLAAELGTLAYEERLKLRVGLPAVVLQTADAGRAAALAASLGARGHTALRCDASSVVASGEMRSLRRFRLDDDALVAVTESLDIELPWSDISALLRANHRTHTRQVTVVTKKNLALGRGIATGGLVFTKAIKQEIVSRSDDSEPVLYVFRRSGQPPWILRQHHANFDALGDQLAPTAAPNFLRAVNALRARAAHALFDDRLVARKEESEELDLLAHLLAMTDG